MSGRTYHRGKGAYSSELGQVNAHLFYYGVSLLIFYRQMASQSLQKLLYPAWNAHERIVQTLSSSLSILWVEVKIFMHASRANLTKLPPWIKVPEEIQKYWKFYVTSGQLAKRSIPRINWRAVCRVGQTLTRGVRVWWTLQLHSQQWTYFTRCEQ